MNPKLIIADEAVSALDVSIRSQILNLMIDLKEEFHLTYIFISHDLSVIKHVCDRIMVMYLGKAVEICLLYTSLCSIGLHSSYYPILHA